MSQALKEKIWQGTYVDMSLLHNDSGASVLAKAGDTSNTAGWKRYDEQF